MILFNHHCELSVISSWYSNLMFQSSHLTGGEDNNKNFEKMSKKFTFKWSDFDVNTSKALSLLREEDFLQDVTLVGDDNSQIAAHKLVLSACSEYFKAYVDDLLHGHVELPHVLDPVVHQVNQCDLGFDC